MFLMNFIKKHNIIILAHFWTLSGLASMHVYAAPSLPDPSNLPRTEPLPNFPTTNRPELEQKEKPSYKPAIPKNTDIKVTVKQFKFTGNNFVSNEQLSFILKDYLSRSVGMLELVEATRIVTHYYRKQGFLLAQAYLPAQDIANNQVEIAVLEGNLGELKLRASENLNEAFLQGMAAHNLKSGDAIQEKNLVRNITTLNSLPGLRATAQLNPGSGIGTSDVEIELKPLPKWQTFVSANNYGNRFTGREVNQATIVMNNPAGIGDQLYATLRSTGTGGQRGLQLGYQTPVSYSGTLLSLSYNYVDYELGGPFAILGATGKSQYFNALVDEPLIRSSQKNLTGRAGVSYKLVSDEVASFALDNRRNIAGIELGLFGDWHDMSGTNQAGISLKYGNVNFKNAFAEALDKSGAQTEGQFIKYDLFASRRQELPLNLSLTMRAEYQGADQNLDSAEKFSLGGASRWRAFGELPATVDRGLLTGIELRKTIFNNNSLARLLLVGLSPYGFVDYGTGSINQNSLSKYNHVSSLQYGVGIDAKFKNNWLLGLAASHQKRDPDNGNTETDDRAWAQLQAEF